MRVSYSTTAVSAAVALVALAVASAGESPLLALARRLQETRAPSCGNAQVQELINENRFCDVMTEPSNTVTFEPCCPGDGVTDQSSTSGGTCRVAETSTAYCLPGNDPPCTTPSAADQLVLNLEITSAPASQECCQTCSCLGDPFCTSFGGGKNIEITCDGRRPDTCQVGRKACHLSRDRAGNKCLYLKDKEFEGQWSSFDEDGSPCQSNYSASGYPTMVMYQFPGFKVELTTAERGIIRDVAITYDNRIYTLNSARCFEHGASAASWTVTLPNGNTNTASSLPAGWVGGPPTMSLQQNSSGTVAEWPWRINSAVGVVIDMVCTRPLNRVKMSRIDVLSLIELDINRDGASGYCVNNEIPRGKSTWERTLMLHDKCTSVNLPDLLSTCKSLTDADCRPATIQAKVSDWCDRADLISTNVRGDIAACKALIVPKGNDNAAATTARNMAWTTLVCQLNKEADLDNCITLISQFGWLSYLQTRSNGLPSASGGDSDTCVDDVTKYSKNTAGSCAQGVSVQYYNAAADDWIESFFVPASKPPCGGSLQIFGDEYPELFLNPVRLSQCDLDISCLVDNQCAPVVGFTTSLLFGTDVCNLERPDCFNCASNLPPASQRPSICTVEPTSPTPAGQCITCCTIDDILNPDIFGGPLCRDVSLQSRAFCNPSDQQFGSLCTAPVLSGSNTSLALYLDRDEAQVSCCATCSTYGDPLGVSFDGTRDKYILCDGRASNCGMSKTVCQNQVDQKGRKCVWNASLAGLPNVDINVNGSPCQPQDYNDAVVVVYDIKNALRVVAKLGERAVITSLLVTIPEGDYLLDGVKCFTDKSGAQGWTWTPSPLANGDPADAYFGLALGETAQGELTQMVTHFATGVMIRVKCIQSTTTTGVVGGERLDVQALVDTNETRVTRIENNDPSFTGFCPTGKMNEKTKQNPNANTCQRQNVLDAVRICSVLGSPACRKKEVELEARTWCTRAALPYGSDICIRHIWDGINKPLNNMNKVADAWTREYCTAVVSRRAPGETEANFIELCISEVELEGIDSAVKKWGDGTHLASYCAMDYTAYSTRTGPGSGQLNCVTGISVQTQNPTTQAWEELFFMPDNFPPCKSPFVIPANADTLVLFTRRVRLHQCDLSQDDCPLLGNEDTHCLENLGFELAYKYTHGAGLCPQG